MELTQKQFAPAQTDHKELIVIGWFVNVRLEVFSVFFDYIYRAIDLIFRQSNCRQLPSYYAQYIIVTELAS